MQSHYRINVALPRVAGSAESVRFYHYFATDVVGVQADATELAKDFRRKWPEAQVTITYWEVTGTEL